MLYTISFMATGGVTVEAESEEEALKLFHSDSVQEAVGMELSAAEVTVTEIRREEL